MAGNTSQIFSKVGDIQGSTLTAANTALDGTGTVGTAFTADATNGGRVEMLRLMALGTNVATVARFWINNGSANTTASNNQFLAEIQLPATTASNSAAINTNTYELPASYASQVPFDTTSLPRVLPPGYKIIWALGTAASAGWSAIVPAGKY